MLTTGAVESTLKVELCVLLVNCTCVDSCVIVCCVLLQCETSHQERPHEDKLGLHCARM